jgi:heme/copper-type cytochrome/quinol oxidase subunit 2
MKKNKMITKKGKSSAKIWLLGILLLLSTLYLLWSLGLLSINTPQCPLTINDLNWKDITTTNNLTILGIYTLLIGILIYITKEKKQKNKAVKAVKGKTTKKKIQKDTNKKHDSKLVRLIFLILLTGLIFAGWYYNWGSIQEVAPQQYESIGETIEQTTNSHLTTISILIIAGILTLTLLITHLLRKKKSLPRNKNTTKNTKKKIVAKPLPKLKTKKTIKKNTTKKQKKTTKKKAVKKKITKKTTKKKKK